MLDCSSTMSSSLSSGKSWTGRDRKIHTSDFVDGEPNLKQDRAQLSMMKKVGRLP